MPRIHGLILAAATLAVPGAPMADPQAECAMSEPSQADIANCLSAVDKNADAAMAMALEFATNAATELDDVTGRAASVAALVTGQTSWSAYRDQHCEFVGTTYGGGSGTGIAIASCRIDLARDRTKTLMLYTQ